MSIFPPGPAAALAGQRLAAEPARSVWVAANAGAGKTRVLVDRVLRLLLAKVPPGAILCLTFTKAAAAEMANRLHRDLAAWATDDAADLQAKLTELQGAPAAPEALAHARQLFARTLDTPGGLKIQTIHAFCQSLLARFPLEAGLAPHFQVMDERTAAELLYSARDRMLRQAAAGTQPELSAALDKVVGLVDETGFGGLMRELLNGRGRLRRLLAAHGDDIERVVAATRTALGLRPGETTAAILEAACRNGSFDRAGLERACAALDCGGSRDGARAELIRAWLGAGEERRRREHALYLGAFYTNGMQALAEKTLASKAARTADPTVLAVLLQEQRRVEAVLDRLRRAAVLEATQAIWRLGDALLAAYASAKTEAALLDYDDLILATLELVREPGVAPWVLFKLDGGLDHILVDEAQDTSPEQWGVIAALAEEFFAGSGARDAERTVFAVGDEKQSIYSFQGADPAAFARMRAHFCARAEGSGRAWSAVQLDLSFRSTPAVLAAVDAVFALAGEGVTAAGTEIRHLAHRAGQAGLVELWPVVGPEPVPPAEPWDAPLDQLSSTSPEARLARRMAETIQGWLAAGERLAAENRPIRPGDIMILVRRRSRFVEEMVRCLKQGGVPVAGTDRMVLTEQIAVKDLLALARFVLLPEDDLTLAEVLKGPLFGFDDDRLQALALGRAGRLWDALQERCYDDLVFAAAHVELVALRARADFMPPFEFFARLLGADGGRRRILGRLGPEAADPLDELLALALIYQRTHVPSLQHFLHWVEAGAAEVKRDLEQGRNEVRVLTVHGAKGLEAPIVFLPDTCGLPDPRLEPRLLWPAEGEPPLMFWPVRRENDSGPVATARRAARLERLNEYRRLLYVGMTRARDRLYICGFSRETAPREGSWYALAEAAIKPLAAPVTLPFGETGWRIAEPQRVPPPVAADAAEVPRAAVLPAFARRPPPPEPEPPRPLVPSRPDGEDTAVLSPLAPETAARYRRGRIIHRLLQSLPDLPPAERATAAARYLAEPVHGLQPQAQADIAAEVLRLFQLPEAALLFGPGSQAEVGIAGLVGGAAIAGQVDRLVVTAERVIVADFKSDRPAPAHPEQVPRIHLRQMAAYRAALASIYPDRPVTAMLVWTEAPRLMVLPDALLLQV